MSAATRAALPAPLDPQLLYEQAPCGYLVLADDGTIRAVNETFLHWTGHRREALVGTRFQQLLPVGDRILFATHALPQLAMAGAVGELVIEVVGTSGVRRPALLTAARTPATDGVPASTRVIVFSAHERRRYEQELIDALHRAEESETRRAGAEADLRFLALHDPLTGLLNRTGLVARVDEVRARGDGDCAGLTALFIDLDDFKTVNDSLGHAAGDELLVAVSRRLQGAVRESATLARQAGDEFVLLDVLEEPADVAALAERLLAVLSAPVVVEGVEVVVSGSIGAAVAEGPDDTLEALLRRADIAMYRAKERGRNGWERHDPSVPDPAAGRLRLLGDLRRGIDAGELRLLYQPRVDVGTGVLAGVEALVRWQHPTRGLLAPDDFIEVAEESGLIRGLGAWVLDEAVAQAVRWQREGPGAPPVEVAVNVSARQLADPALVGTVRSALDRHGLDPSQLVLEITETALMGDPRAALSALAALKALGVGLAVDDFGTGYSSLTYLKQFPVDELKIDRSFVAGLGADRGDTAIVASCIQLAHAIGLRAVAEGVETEAQRLALVELGCDLGQGYHYARPLEAAGVRSWLRVPAGAR